MFVLLGVLLTLGASSGAVPCPDYCEVVSGVFHPNVSVNYSDAQLVCDCYKADLANLAQVTNAYNHSLQSCSWGWVKEQMMVMLRRTVKVSCGNASTGVLLKTPCVHIEAQSGFCFKRNVVKGVFQVFAQANKTDGDQVCGTYNATWATWEQVDTANSSGYATCSAGWVANVTQYRFHNTSWLNCSNGTSSNGTNSTSNAFFCFRAQLFDSGLYPVFPTSGSQLLNKTEARNQCVSLHDILATEEQMKNSNNSALPRGLTAWYEGGIIKISASGMMEAVPCVNYPQVNGSVYCYQAKLEDAVCLDNTWKKITMGCILASIFIILLIAAACMRGNQFICCLDKPHRVTVDGLNEVQSIPPRVPTWNKTGIYKPVTDVVDPKYRSNLGNLPEPRRPAIRPEMFIYRSHLLNVIHRPERPATLQRQSRVYDNLGYDESGEQ